MTQNNYQKFIGIDVSKNWIDVCFENCVKKVDRTREAILSMIKKDIGALDNTLCVMESTGGYERLVAEVFQESGASIHIAHPSKFAAFARLKRSAKTDQLDAYLLMKYGDFLEQKEIRSLSSKEQEERRAYAIRLEQLKALHCQEMCRLKSCQDSLIRKSLEDSLQFLKNQMKTLTNTLTQKIESCPQTQKNFDILKSMKGIGPIIASSLICLLPELGQIGRKQIVALVGVAPTTKQSGLKKSYAKTMNGRSSVRKSLYFAALVSTRYDSPFKDFYEKLCLNGKPKKVALVAVMRKIIVTLNAMIAYQQKWRSP